MCCFITALLLLGPRAAILVWWVIDTARWTLAFSGSWIWPVLGFIFAPWTTLAYVLVAPGGIVLFDWVILGIGILLDLSSWFGGYRNRKEVPYYS
ncbi:MAG: hypothetical protein ACK2UK_01565 [Candidatus Promineifilaceae bacterium]